MRSESEKQVFGLSSIGPYGSRCNAKDYEPVNLVDRLETFLKVPLAFKKAYFTLGESYVKGRLSEKTKNLVHATIVLPKMTLDLPKYMTRLNYSIQRVLNAFLDGNVIDCEKEDKDLYDYNIMIVHYVVMTYRFMSFIAFHKEVKIDYAKLVTAQLEWGFDFNDYCKDCVKYSYIYNVAEIFPPELECLKLEKENFGICYDVREVSYIDIFPPQFQLPFGPLEEDLKDVENFAMVSGTDVSKEDLVLLRGHVKKTLDSNKIILKMPDDIDYVSRVKSSKCLNENMESIKNKRSQSSGIMREYEDNVLEGIRFKRTYIFKNPCETRDGVNANKHVKNYLKDFSYLLNQILKPVKYSGIGKKEFKFNFNKRYIELDVEKDGHTHERDVLRVFCEELEDAYPEFPFSWFYYGTIRSTILGYKGEELKPVRGIGLGMLNELAGFMNGTIISMVHRGRFEVTNDDIIIESNFDDLSMTNRELKMVKDVMNRFGRPIKDKKKCVSMAGKYCENYSKMAEKRYGYKVDKNLIISLSIMNIRFSPFLFDFKEKWNHCFLAYDYRSYIDFNHMKDIVRKEFFPEHLYEDVMPPCAGGFLQKQSNNLDWTVRRYFEMSNKEKRWFQNHFDPPKVKTPEKKRVKPFFFLKEGKVNNFWKAHLNGAEELLSIKKRIENIYKNINSTDLNLKSKLKLMGKTYKMRSDFFKKESNQKLFDNRFIEEFVESRPRPYAIPEIFVEVIKDDNEIYPNNSIVRGTKWDSEGFDPPCTYDDYGIFSVETDLELIRRNGVVQTLKGLVKPIFTLYEDKEPLFLIDNIGAGDWQDSCWLNPYHNLSLKEYLTHYGRKEIVKFIGPKDPLRTRMYSMIINMDIPMYLSSLKILILKPTNIMWKLYDDNSEKKFIRESHILIMNEAVKWKNRKLPDLAKEVVKPGLIPQFTPNEFLPKALWQNMGLQVYNEVLDDWIEPITKEEDDMARPDGFDEPMPDLPDFGSVIDFNQIENEENQEESPEQEEGGWSDEDNYEY